MRATRRGQPCSEGEATARVLCSSAPRQPVGDDALPGRPLRAPGGSRPGRQPVSGAPVSTVYVAVSSQSRAPAGSPLRSGLPPRFPRSLASRWRGHAGSGRGRRGLRRLHVARECAFRDRCGERRDGHPFSRAGFASVPRAAWAAVAARPRAAVNGGRQGAGQTAPPRAAGGEQRACRSLSRPGERPRSLEPWTCFFDSETHLAHLRNGTLQ